ncbi:MAG: HAD hydrolase-like protein [Deltaproteobacteria bacterium]|nr:HAD hydrolase-like protein [Deltaproteobacteria bacterium]
MEKNDMISEYITPVSPVPTSLTPSGKLEEKIEVILFDVYGTLFISRSGDIGMAKKKTPQTEKLEKLLQEFGIKKDAQSVLNRFYAAIENQHELLKKKGVDFPEVEIDQIWMRVLETDDIERVRAFAVTYELITNPVYPMPNLEKMLSVCQDSNVLMGIISNAQFYTPYLFNWFLGSLPEDLGFHPDLILYSYEFGYAKPSTFMFQVAAERLKHMDMSVGSALYIGNDMLNDIYPAKQAGFKTALFAGDERSLRLRENDPKCKDLSADLVITDLIQLLDYI